MIAGLNLSGSVTLALEIRSVPALHSGEMPARTNLHSVDVSAILFTTSVALLEALIGRFWKFRKR